jgi:hypothetical protein
MMPTPACAQDEQRASADPASRQPLRQANAEPSSLALAREEDQRSPLALAALLLTDCYGGVITEAALPGFSSASAKRPVSVPLLPMARVGLPTQNLQDLGEYPSRNEGWVGETRSALTRPPPARSPAERRQRLRLLAYDRIQASGA